MVTSSLLAFVKVPADYAGRLKAIGMVIDKRSNNATMHGDALVIADGGGKFPWALVAKTLGVSEIIKGEASFSKHPGGGEVVWDVEGITVGPTGARHRMLAQGTDALAEDDVHGDAETVARLWVDEVVVEHMGLSLAGESFGLRFPKGWRAPDPFARAVVGNPVVSWASASDSTTPPLLLDRTTIDWIAARLRSAGVLDESQPAPDLARWERRLVSRHGGVDTPGYAADWESLTRPDRCRPAAKVGHVAAWKLGVIPAILTAPEVATLAVQLGLAGAEPPASLAQLVASLRERLALGHEIIVAPA